MSKLNLFLGSLLFERGFRGFALEPGLPARKVLINSFLGNFPQ